MSVAPRHRLDYLPLEHTHIERLMGIEIEAYPEPWTRGMFLEELRNPRSYFRVVEAGERIIGYGGFWLILDEAHITSVTIQVESRGLGYGRQLMQHLHGAALEKGASLLTLEVRGSNLAARGLYESMGFEAVGLRKGYYSTTGEDAIVMTLKIGGARP